MLCNGLWNFLHCQKLLLRSQFEALHNWKTFCMLWQLLLGQLEQRFSSLMYFSDYSSLSEFSHVDRRINRTKCSCSDFEWKLKKLLKGEARVWCWQGRVFDYSIILKRAETRCEVLVPNYKPPGCDFWRVSLKKMHLHLKWNIWTEMHPIFN